MENFIVDNIASIYSEFVLTGGEMIRPCAKYSDFSSTSDFSNKGIKFDKVFMCVNLLQ